VRRSQHGLVAVEFALIGLVALTLLFSAIETGRTFFLLNAAAEATRLAARVAIVSTDAAAKAAAMAYADTLGGLTADNVEVTYYNEAGAAPATPADRAFVTVRLVDFTHSLFIPGLPLTINVPEFPTTLPVESQGVDPD
jgi:Flp pilus assembly protein TadG